jgi:serine/threonine protein kinase
VGAYEILAPLGAGGMDEVYRARDPKLGRDVAVKILPVSFSQDICAKAVAQPTSNRRTVRQKVRCGVQLSFAFLLLRRS